MYNGLIMEYGKRLYLKPGWLRMGMLPTKLENGPDGPENPVIMGYYLKLGNKQILI